MTETLTLPKTVVVRLLEVDTIGSEYAITENGADAEFGFRDDEHLQYFTHFDTVVQEAKGGLTRSKLIVIERSSDEALFGYTCYEDHDRSTDATSWSYRFWEEAPENIDFETLELHEEVLVTRAYSKGK